MPASPSRTASRRRRASSTACSPTRATRTDDWRQAMAEHRAASVETLKAITEAFNAHDLDAIMEFFADDCSLEMPRGPEPWGQRFTGKGAVRAALATRFA